MKAQGKVQRDNKINAGQDNSGFTLIEIICVIVILGIISVFGFSFISNSARTYIALKNQRMLYHRSAAAMERMSRAIRDARSIRTVVASPGKIRIQRAHGTPQDPDVYVTFALSGTTLQRGSNAVDADPAIYHDLAPNCSVFTVNNSANEILLVLTLAVATGESVTVQSKVYPKNLPYGATPYSGRNFNGDWAEEVLQQ
jgi:prepilin-type N-terminal cleavage/methylation domain-containing protein